ncbi:hypothetical protein M3D17_06000 [Corynebacterium sanguinis]|uniref:hypothetical protein n=1 Tax=Corynebacterium sanguinis TaxID=2594913 RepID=UPI00223B9229|nr:hypothetical protein [Corynebacterium sanguinis]MCT2023400.1 hypothetical protein [Corynebacterium sanguinis]
MTTTVTQNLSSLAAEAATIPGSDPAVVARIDSVAKAIAREYLKTEGMNLDVVAASANKLGTSATAPRRGRGIGGFAANFIKDVLSKIGAEHTSNWFDSIGVSTDEKGREDAEGIQGDNAEQLCHDVTHCCDAIREIDTTADEAIGGVADVISALLSIARIHPIGRKAGLILPLVLNGFEQIKGIVDDRNGQVETCLGAVTQACNDMLEHQPQPHKQWDCPPVSTAPSPTAPAVPAAPTAPASLDDGCEPQAQPQASTQASTQAPTSISFNFDLGASSELQTHSVALQPPTCDVAAQFSSPQPDASPLTGILAQIGISITLECLNHLAESIEAAAECPGETCCTHGETEEVAEVAPAEPVAAAPPELAEVEEPPAPAAKLQAAGLQTPPPAPPPVQAETQPVQVETPPAQVETPPADPTPKMRKSGEW